MHRSILRGAGLRRGLATIVIVISACVSSMGQTQDIEIELAKLRKILHVPASINIRPSTSLLPNSEHIKVFIATGEDKKGYDVFVQKLDDWNKANALKY